MKKWEYAQAMGLCEEAVDNWVGQCSECGWGLDDPDNGCKECGFLTIEQCSECKTTAFSDEMCWHMATPICPSCFTALNEVTA